MIKCGLFTYCKCIGQSTDLVDERPAAHQMNGGTKQPHGRMDISLPLMIIGLQNIRLLTHTHTIMPLIFYLWIFPANFSHC